MEWRINRYNNLNSYLNITILYQQLINRQLNLSIQHFSSFTFAEGLLHMYYALPNLMVISESGSALPSSSNSALCTRDI